MGKGKEAVEAAGFMGEGIGTELEQAVWGGETAADQPAGVPLCQRALLDRNGNKQAECIERLTSTADGASAASVAALQHFGSVPATLWLNFHGRRIFPDRSSGGDERPWITQSAARSSVSGDGAGGDRAGSSEAVSLPDSGIAQYGVGAAARCHSEKANRYRAVGERQGWG